MNKIIIFGFPHCGTSILKSIVGHVNEVEEIINETKIITEQTSLKKYVVCKFPFTIDDFFTEEYNDYIKIFIIRNPLYVFSSLNSRFKSNIPDNHNIDSYMKTLSKFISLENHELKNLYRIRYEDMFEDNYEGLRTILDSIGLSYTDDIFNNTKYENQIEESIKIDRVKTLKQEDLRHEEFRTWQINQPFKNNNEPTKINLTREQKTNFLGNKEILSKIYPEIFI